VAVEDKQTMKRLLLAILVVAGLVAAVADQRPALAHALLARADPPPNAQLREPPKQLTLYFTEALERRFSRVRVVNQSGGEVQDRIEFDDADSAVMRVSLKPLEAGFYNVAWENVSAVDGHRITGSYPLTVLNADGSVPAGSPPAFQQRTAGAEADPERVAVKAAILISASLLTGGLAFLFFAAPAFDPVSREALRRRVTLTAVLALVVLLLAGAAELLLQAAELDVGFGTVLDTRWGGRWLLRNLALVVPLAAVALLAFRQNGSGRVAATLGLIGSLSYLAVVSSVSHAAAGSGAAWAAAADFVHLVAAAVWIGMLAQLLLLFVWSRVELEREARYALLVGAVRRFSAVAVVSVALLLFTGVISAVIEIDRPSDLLQAAYGQALLAKLLLLVPLLGIGAANAYVLRPELEEEAESRLRGREDVLADLESRLSNLVRWEFTLALLVLIIAGFLSQETPTRGAAAESATSEGKFVATREIEDLGVTLVVDPNQPGVNTFEVYLTGAAETVERVRLDFVPGGNVDQEARLILDVSNPPTFYIGQGPYLAQAGKWQITVDLRRLRGSDLRLPFDLRPAGPGGAVESKGGGSFANPLRLTTASVLLLFAAGLVAVTLVTMSRPRAGMPAGYLGEVMGSLADRMATAKIRPAWSLAVLIFVGIGLGLLLGSHFDRPLSKQQASAQNPVDASPESIARGAMLFNQNCALCHGESGRGDGPASAGLRIQPANLYDHIPYHPDQFFFGVITNGLSGVMPSFKSSISEDDRWNILNYMRDRFGEAPAVR
jgi:copper transport protein